MCAAFPTNRPSLDIPQTLKMNLQAYLVVLVFVICASVSVARWVSPHQQSHLHIRLSDQPSSRVVVIPHQLDFGCCSAVPSSSMRPLIDTGGLQSAPSLLHPDSSQERTAC
jgi:hypothetical protein